MFEATRFQVALLTDQPESLETVRRVLRARPEFEIVLQEALSEDGLATEVDAEDIDLVLLVVEQVAASFLEELPRVLGRGVSLLLSSSVPADAVLAYQAGAIDFVQRPIGARRLEVALDRARRHLEASRARPEPRDRRRSGSLPAGGYASRVVARSRNRWVVIRSEEIHQIEANRNYVSVHAGSSRLRVRKTIRELERVLDPEEFFRVHRSFIVRIDEVRELSALRDGDYELVLRDGSKVPLSRSRREAFFDALSRRRPQSDPLSRVG